MLFGVSGLNRTLIGIFVLVAGIVTVTSCGSSSSSTTTGSSKLSFRVFVSNPLFPNGAGGTPVMNIVDASKDILSTARISLAANSTQPGLMALSPNRKYTMVFSVSGNSITLIDNTSESIAQVTTGTTNVPVPSFNLPGATESMFIGNNNTIGYAAVPTAPVLGQPPGAVEVFDLLRGSISGSIPVPGARFLVPSPDGNHILVFGNNSDTATVLTTSFVGTHTDPRSFITGLDRPVWGVFIDDGSAYIMNCGAECGGVAANVSVLSSLPPSGTTVAFNGTTIPVRSATTGLASGGTLYVAGTPPGMGCVGTAAAACGALTAINTSSLTASAPLTITDGYHDLIQITPDGQLFIGARGCSNVTTGAEVRGCLTIFDTTHSHVVIPPQNGDVTGIQPITGRNVVYLVQNAELAIYDTTTDKLQVTSGDTQNNQGQVNIVGQLFDVKLVD
jgi:hypothetical protein